jgi:hypothetical protein
VELLNL